MGITKKDVELLFYSRAELGVSFSKTLTLGRLEMFVSKEEIAKVRSIYHPVAVEHISKGSDDTKYSESLFKLLGAQRVDSLDFSDYEGASIVHDLNNGVPKQYHNSFSAIIDGGTIEHVFNFPVAIKSCMDCLEVGGHYIGITPANNQMGHGFYQFSPELYFRVFSRANGFAVQGMYLRTSDSLYKVADPLEVRSRVELVNARPTTLIVVAKKIENISQFQTPQQSDYVDAWDTVRSVKTGVTEAGRSKTLNIYRRLMPLRVKIILRNLYDIFTKEKVDDADLGTIDPNHFKKIELAPTKH